MAILLNFSPTQISGRYGMGPFELILEEDGGIIRGAKTKLGFGRRHIEKVSCSLPFVQAVNFSDRIDFNAAPAYNHVSALAFESILGLEVPERAQYIRTMLLELSRISSHLLYFSNIARSVEQISLLQYCLRERERFCDIFEMYCGSRLGFGSICIGGVREDATDGWFFRIEKAIHSVQEFLPELGAILLDHPFFQERARGLAVLSSDMATKWNISGPNARASGLLRDMRVQQPFGAYSQVQMVGQSVEKFTGDVWSRVTFRLFEIQQSMEMIRALFKKIPSGNYRIRIGSDVESGPGSVFQRVEGPRGEIGVFVDCMGGAKSSKMRYFTPSEMMVCALPTLLTGIRTEDVFLAIQSLDISFSEVDK